MPSVNQRDAQEDSPRGHQFFATTAYDRFIGAAELLGLKVGRKTAGNTPVQCPGPTHKNGDRRPSLSIRQTRDRLLVKCHAGCDTSDVLDALGLTASDLFDKPAGAVYAYTDAVGRPLREVHRRPDKTFRQHITDKSKVTLYRLPQVLDAVKAGFPIWLVEGEQDVETLESLGEVATTAPMGAENFDKVDPSPLYGAIVKAVVDRDEPGQKWMRQVWAALDGKARSLSFLQAPPPSKDVTDLVLTGAPLSDLQLIESAPPAAPPARQVHLTPASEFTVKPVHWLWADRIPMGSVVLLAGREGIGKSTVAYQIAADVTRGVLPGKLHGQGRAVVVAAPEDSWEHTIVPRLIAAGADLAKVYRVDVTTVEGLGTSLSLPRDIHRVGEALDEVGAAMLLLDPLISRLDHALDSHKDADVRMALEPLAGLADRHTISVVGITHLNKSTQADPLNMLMGSRAFASVARAVLFVMKAPDDDNLRLLGQPKNNLGRTDGLPTLTFTIGTAHVADTDEGPVTTGRIQWQTSRDQSIEDALSESSDDPDVRSSVSDAAMWLTDYLTAQADWSRESSKVKRAGRAAGHTDSALARARKRLKVEVTSSGFPRQTYWAMPGTTPVVSPRAGDPTTDTTDTTGESYS